ncbi:MAG: hypothetical protein JXK07_15380 [Spirochaetes bacterium]|nr:hypothetical protein [Spirochaetota bacterium]MBN2769352.1 hypothetical protein [Spirochaetota bacterium]
MKKVIVLSSFFLFFIITSCGTNLYDLANSGKTETEEEDPDTNGNPSILLRAVYLSTIISSNSILPTTPVSSVGTTDLIFQIENTGDSALMITSIAAESSSFECMEPMPFTVEPGAEHQFTLRITSPGEGSILTQLRVESNDPETPAFDFTINIIAHSSPIYVSADADEAGSGTYSNPYRSLSEAIGDATSDGTIIIGSGNYDGSFVINLPMKLLGNYRYNGSGWVVVPEDEAAGRPVLLNSELNTDRRTVHITASPLSSEISIISLDINTPNASANASSILVDSQTSASGGIVIRNCNISNPDNYNANSSSHAIRLTSGNQNGTVSITDSFITGGNSNGNSYGICFNPNSLSLSGFNLIVRRNSIEAGGGSTANANFYGIFINTNTSNNIADTTFNISDNTKIEGGTFTGSTLHESMGLKIYLGSNNNLSDFFIRVNNNQSINGGFVSNNHTGITAGISITTNNITTISNSAIDILNNVNIRSQSESSGYYGQNGTAIYVNCDMTPLTISGNRIKSEANVSSRGISLTGESQIICINNIVEAESNTGGANPLYFDWVGDISVYNNYLSTSSTNTDSHAIWNESGTITKLDMVNNILIFSNTGFGMYSSDPITNIIIKNNYFFPESNALHEDGTSYSITSLNLVSGCVDNFTTAAFPSFDSNLRLTSSAQNNDLKIRGIEISTVPYDIMGDPRPGSDGYYAVGPYEF